ncbi:MAG: hypothetical protein ABIP94_01215 [Planctomycetota bacterium]
MTQLRLCNLSRHSPLAVYELAWFAAGAAVSLAVVLGLRFRTRVRTAARTSKPAATSQAPLVLPRVPLDARRVALSLAEQLANLVSGLEGRAHNLIEAAPNRAMLPAAAEALLIDVQRLRTLHKKLIAFGQERAVERGSIDVAVLVASLTDEVQEMQLGMQLRWEPPPALPRIAAAPDIARDSLLFLIAALLRAERGATHLSIQAEHCFADREPSVQLELALEWITEAPTPVTDGVADTNLALDLEAANNLIACQGGNVWISHLPGRSVRAVVRWPAAVSAPIEPRQPSEVAIAATASPAAEPSNERAALRHQYGGALVLEADPAIRAMLASELKATGRAVFACADGASARTFLEATPDRFELIIVDDPKRLDDGNALARAIKSLAPNLKVCMLAQGNEPAPGAWPGLRCIQKPFGVHELRHALAAMLAK